MPTPGMPANGNPLADLMQRQLEATRAAEEQLLQGFQSTVNRWCERRHRTVRAYSDFSREVMEARSPQELMVAWMQLSSGAIERMSEDARDQMSMGQTFARCVASGNAAQLWDEAADTGARFAAKATRTFEASTGASEEARH